MRNDAGPDSEGQTGTGGPSAHSHFHGSVFHGPVHTGSGALNVIYHITNASPDPLERLALALARKVAAVERVARQSLLGEAGTAAEIPYTSRLTWLGHAGEPTAGTLDTIADDFRALPHARLAVLGSAGSGKTVLALDFVQRLLEQRQPGEVVPVRLPLTQWNPDVALDRWLAAQIAEGYGLRRRHAARLVHNRMVLPVLDGLDEMDATPAATSRAGQALEQINRYHGSRGPAPLILTCRSETYARLARDSGTLSHAATVILEDLTQAHVRAYLTQVLAARPAAERGAWAEVLGNLHRMPAGALSTPWRIYLATTVYAGGYDPRELLSFSDLGSMDRLLLSRLIPVAAAAFPRPRYEARTISRWLGVLARSLEPAHGQAGRERTATDLVLYRLPGPRGPRRLQRLQYAVTFLAGAVVLTPLLARAWRVNSYGNAIAVTVVFLLIDMAFSFLAIVVSSAAGYVPVRLMPYRRRSKVTWRQLQTWISEKRRAFLGLLATLGTGSLFMCVIFLVLILVSGHLAAAEILEVAGAWASLGVGIPLIAVGIPVAGQALATWFTTGESLPVLRPGAPLRDDLALSAVLAAAVIPWAFLRPGPLTLAAAFVVWFCGSRAWLRYGLAVACYRLHGLLPLRLIRFLAWAHGAGLVRAAGIAYQFRHAEFQRWLAANADSPGRPHGSFRR
jgi:NACHT domain